MLMKKNTKNIILKLKVQKQKNNLVFLFYYKNLKGNFCFNININ